MTVSGAQVDSRVVFNCTGSTAYPLGSSFLFIDSSDLIVVRIDEEGVETTLTETSDYTVSGGSGGTGTVTTAATYSDGFLLIYRDTVAKQEYDAQVGDGFNTDTFELALDRMILVIQEVVRDMGRSIQLDPFDITTTSIGLPVASANKAIGWNGTATGLDNIDVATTAALAAAVADVEAQIATASAFRGCLVTKSVDQTLPDTIDTVLTFDVEAYDTDGIHDNVTNNARLTVPAGVTRVKLNAYIHFAPGVTAVDAVAYIYKNALQDLYTGAARVSRSIKNTNEQRMMHMSTAVLEVVAGDYFFVSMYAANAATSDIYGGPNYTWFSMEIIE